MSDVGSDAQDSVDFFDRPNEVDVGSGQTLIFEEKTADQRPLNCSNGFAHTSNPAPYWSDLFPHRSLAEAVVTRCALNRDDLLFSVNVVFSDSTKKRIEIDQVFLRNGMIVFVEIDGGYHSDKLWKDEEDRLKRLRKNLFHVLRFDSPEVPTIDWGESVIDAVEDFFDRFEKINIPSHLFRSGAVK